MADERPLCAGCDRPIEPGSGRYRRGSEQFHAECYERATKADAPKAGKED